jgi:hypothetical protein
MLIIHMSTFHVGGSRFSIGRFTQTETLDVNIETLAVTILRQIPSTIFKTDNYSQ